MEASIKELEEALKMIHTRKGTFVRFLSSCQAKQASISLMWSQLITRSLISLQQVCMYMYSNAQTQSWKFPVSGQGAIFPCNFRKTLCPVPGNFLPVICVCVQCTCSIQQYLMITGREDYISIHLVDLYNSTLNVYTKSNSTENKKSFIPWILRM